MTSAGDYPKVIASGLGYVIDVDTDGAYLYFAVLGGNVTRVPIVGGSLTTLVTNANAYGVRVDGLYLYYTTQQGELLRALKSDGTSLTSYGNITGTGYSDLALDGNYIYLMSYLKTSVWRVTK